MLMGSGFARCVQPGGKSSGALESVTIKLQNLSDQEKKVGAGVAYVTRAGPSCRVCDAQYP